MKTFFGFTLLLMAVAGAGCSAQSKSIQAGSANGEPKEQPKIKQLLSRSDVVLVKHFYERTVTLTAPVDPKFRSIVLKAANVVVEPVWIYEPGKEKDGRKGAKIYLNDEDLRESYGVREGQKAEVYLDVDELRDLDSAMTYLRASDSSWRAKSAGDHIETAFHSKDGFNVTAFKDNTEQETLGIGNGLINVFVPFESSADLQAGLKKAIELLDSKS
ncbi:MAG TPA: hypothetical protein VGL89_10905 [Candidatus Koribacter sp.]|jgi:hypothetical protein